MTLRLVLITHAPTPATHAASFAADESLTAAGQSSAETVRSGPRRVRSAWRGPEARCAETAEALGLDARIDSALTDLNVGGWRGLDPARIQADDPAGLAVWLTDPEVAPHGGETIGGLLTRVSVWLAALPRVPGRVAAVTHPAVVRAAVLCVLGAPARSFWNLDVKPLSETRMSWSGEKWRLQEVGRPLIEPFSST